MAVAGVGIERHIGDDRQLRHGLLHGGSDLRIFAVDDAGDLERGLGVKALRCLVLALGRQFLKGGSRVMISAIVLGGGRLLLRRAG